MLKASKKPISSPFQTLCTLPMAGDTHTHLHVVDSAYQVPVFFSMHFLLSHLCTVTVGFWLLSIQPPDFLLGIHASCSLGTRGSAGASSVQFSSVQFSRSVMSDSLRLLESQHTRSRCPSPTPGVLRLLLIDKISLHQHNSFALKIVQVSISKIK